MTILRVMLMALGWGNELTWGVITDLFSRGFQRQYKSKETASVKGVGDLFAILSSWLREKWRERLERERKKESLKSKRKIEFEVRERGRIGNATFKAIDIRSHCSTLAFGFSFSLFWMSICKEIIFDSSLFS